MIFHYTKFGEEYLLYHCITEYKPIVCKIEGSGKNPMLFSGVKYI